MILCRLDCGDQFFLVTIFRVGMCDTIPVNSANFYLLAVLMLCMRETKVNK